MNQKQMKTYFFQLKRFKSKEEHQRIIDRLKEETEGNVVLIDPDMELIYPVQQWIPVSKGLPDELEEVNITWINTEPEPYYGFVKDKPMTGSGVYYQGRWYWYSAVCVDYLKEYGFSPNDSMDDAIKVTAWMPMPEPYEGKLDQGKDERGTYGRR